MGTRKNTVFSYLKILGRVFRGIKSLCGNGGTHSLGFPHKSTFLSYGITLGRVFGGIKSPCGNGDTHSLGFPHQTAVFSHGKTLGCYFSCRKSPCRNGDTHSLVLGEDRSRTRVLQGASSACQPTGQSDDGGPSGQGIPRSEPSFSDIKATFSDLISTTEKQVF